MTDVLHPAFETAVIIGDRITAAMTTSAKVFVDDLNYQRLAKRSSDSEFIYVVVSPEEVTRTIASRRKVRTGSVEFTLQISISKHIGQVLSSDIPASRAFYTSVQKILDAAMGVTDSFPDGQDISLAAPWGLVRWPEGVTEVPADQDISANSLRFRGTQFQFQATRGG